jgi:hypothetical protein
MQWLIGKLLSTSIIQSNSQVHRKIIAFVACPKQQKAILEGNLNGRCEENDVMNSLH